MSYADNYAERNLGPYFEGALKISDAIRDGARLPQLEDLDVVKAVIDEHVTIADNREAERYANKIIMEWKEANNKTTVFGPFAPENPQGLVPCPPFSATRARTPTPLSPSPTSSVAIC